jgi:membrane associated rhomboid family serine protease
MMRGTGIFLAMGLVSGFFIGSYMGYVVWGSLAGLVFGIILAAVTSRLLNKNR